MIAKVVITILWLNILFSLVFAYIENSYRLLLIALFNYIIIGIIEKENNK